MIALLKFKGTEVEVLASLTAIGAQISPKHVHKTGATKTIWLRGLKSVSKRSTANLRIDSKAFTIVRTLSESVQEDRGPHVDLLLRGPKAIAGLQKYVDALKLIGETGMTFPASMLSKWPGIAGKKGKMIAGALLVYHTPISEDPSGLELPLDREAHRFA